MTTRVAIGSVLLIALMGSTAASAGGIGGSIKAGYEFKKPKAALAADDISLDQNGVALPAFYSGQTLVQTFEGISQYDAARFSRNFIPPDTIGAVGKTQYMETTNGVYAVYDKATGLNTRMTSDLTFWAAAGQTGTNGDSRIMYNAKTQRWIVVAFGANAKDLQIAVSDTSNALGAWKSTKFTGYGGLGFGATADYPTLALDNNAVYIGTNNFAPASATGANSFRGTTLNVIPLSSLFSGSAPTTTGLVQFTTPFSSSSSTNDFSRGFAIQGVNSDSASSTGKVIAVSLNAFAVSRYDVLNAGNAGAVRTDGIDIGSPYDPNSPGRQPSALNPRVIDTLDDRISSSSYEVNGRIYAVHTVTPEGTDYTVVRYYVIDSATNVILDEGQIGQAGYDFYQGSIAVNRLGQVVIGYNRSGSSATDGKIRFYARSFKTSALGELVQTGDEILLKESLTADYHNGSIDGAAAVGRQRWGDYSQVSIDPSSSHGFWLIGEFAREPNNAANGHPGGTGGTRWGTWIAALDVGGVPEPSSWAMLIAGFGLTGAAMRRRRMVTSVTA